MTQHDTKVRIGGENMIKRCATCGKQLDTLVPFKCKRCGQYFCGEHRLPEAHNCPSLSPDWGIWKKHQEKMQGIKKPIVSTSQPKITAKPQKVSTSSSESFRKPPGTFDRLKKWFFNKTHPQTRLRVNEFGIHLGLLIGFIFLSWLTFENAKSLNDIDLWIFKLGGIILIIFFILMLRSLYKLLVNLKYGIKGLANGYKVIGSIVAFVICILFIVNADSVVGTITEVDYGKFNPVDVDWENLTTSESNNDDSGFWEPPISEEDKFVGTWKTDSSGAIMDLGKIVTFFSDGTVTLQVMGLTATYEIKEGYLAIEFYTEVYHRFLYDYEFSNSGNTLTLTSHSTGSIYVYTKQP